MNFDTVTKLMSQQYEHMEDIKNEFKKIFESVVNSETIKPETEKEIVNILVSLINMYEQNMYLGTIKSIIVSTKEDSTIESFQKCLLESHENHLSESIEIREDMFKELRNHLITNHDDLYNHLLEHVTYTDQK